MTSFEEQRLRYLDASQVEHPDGTLDGFEICTDSQGTLGCLQGVLVEPSRRRVRYFVVGPRGWRRRKYLVSAECPARLDCDDSRIYVEADRSDVRPYEPRDVANFAEADVVDAMFAPRVA